MNVVKFQKTGNFAPTSWLGITNNSEPIRISIRVTDKKNNEEENLSRLRIVRGEIPLASHDKSKTIEDEILVEGNPSKLTTREMIKLVKEYDVYTNIANSVNNDEDISDIKDSINKYIKQK